MALALTVLLTLAQSCAPAVAPETLLSVAATESAFDPLTIGVNGSPHRALHPANTADAVRQAQALRAEGANFDVGLAQINVHTLDKLGLSLADAFDPCRNLAAEAAVLTGGYVAARRRAGEPQAALQVALSAYNTGSAERGFRNGYVARVYRAAAQVVPALQLSFAAPAAPPEGVVRLRPVAVVPPEAPKPPKPPKAALDVFARGASATLVWKPASKTPIEPDGPTALNHQPGDPS